LAKSGWSKFANLACQVGSPVTIRRWDFEAKICSVWTPRGVPNAYPAGTILTFLGAPFYQNSGPTDDPFWQNFGPPDVCNYVTLWVDFFGPIFGRKKHPTSGPKSGPKIEPKNDPNFVSKCSPKNRPIFWDPLAPSRASKTKLYDEPKKESKHTKPHETRAKDKRLSKVIRGS
jgi:hypothetical protein